MRILIRGPLLRILIRISLLRTRIRGSVLRILIRGTHSDAIGRNLDPLWTQSDAIWTQSDATGRNLDALWTQSGRNRTQSGQVLRSREGTHVHETNIACITPHGRMQTNKTNTTLTFQHDLRTPVRHPLQIKSEQSTLQQNAACPNRKTHKR